METKPKIKAIIIELSEAEKARLSDCEKKSGMKHRAVLVEGIKSIEKRIS